MVRYIVSIMLLIGISGCANTETTSFTDPAFKSERFNNFVVKVDNTDFQSKELIANEICVELRDAGARCTSSLNIFPPTRSYSNDEKSKILKERNVGGYLVILVGDGSTSTNYIGSQQFGTVNVYGNYATTNTNSMPIYSFSRQAGYNSILIDTKTQNKAWVGGSRTSGQGLVNITDDAFASSLASSLVDALRNNGHL